MARSLRPAPTLQAGAGRRPPHCMLFANTIYDWPFDLAHAGGDAVDVLDIHGKPHVESCDPGIFPSYFYDYSKPAGRCTSGCGGVGPLFVLVLVSRRQW